MNADLLKTHTVQTSPAHRIRRIAVIDPGVESFPTPLNPSLPWRIADATPGTQVVRLDATRDGCEQIAEILAHYTNLEALHLISHGQPGSVRLGNGVLSDRTLPDSMASLKEWGNALAADGEIWLYGCCVGAGDIGRRFIQTFSEITGKSVAASTTPIGNAALGGNWELDATVGDIRSSQAFKEEDLARYPGLLNINLANVIYAVQANSRNIRVLDLIDGSSEIFGTLDFMTSAIAREAGSGLVYYVEFRSFGAGNQVGARVATWNPETGENRLLGTLGRGNGNSDPDDVLANLGGSIAKLAQASPNTTNPDYQNQLFALGSSTELFRIDRDTGKASYLGNISTVPGSAPQPIPTSSAVGAMPLSIPITQISSTSVRRHERSMAERIPFGFFGSISIPSKPPTLAIRVCPVPNRGRWHLETMGDCTSHLKATSIRFPPPMPNRRSSPLWGSISPTLPACHCLRRKSTFRCRRRITWIPSASVKT
ncbi:MAG: DUF4347 domain-containing protein [Cyanobacteria bacterium J055]|nr:MAG: DUF4347 domain-containing protein [Cyanobacteria bacterium J055]